MSAIPNLQLIGRECRKLDPQAWRDPTDDPVPAPAPIALAVETRRHWQREMEWLLHRAEMIRQMLEAAS